MDRFAPTVITGERDGIVDPGWRRRIEIVFEAIALTIGTLLPIMNPFSTAPLFVSLTAGFDERRRNREARMACLYAFAILAVFLLIGAAIIDTLGISVSGFGLPEG